MCSKNKACTLTCLQTVPLEPSVHFVSYALTLTPVIAVTAVWPQWNVCDVVNFHKRVLRREKANSVQGLKSESPVWNIGIQPQPCDL